MKVYELDITTDSYHEEEFTIWIATDKKMMLPDESAIISIKEIDVRDDSSDIDLIVE
jgi:hypothetical protein